MWTTEPTESGWYWWRMKNPDSMQLVKFHKQFHAPTEHGPNLWMLTSRMLGAEWQGPIAPAD
jgi:hypothetical protein